MNEKVTPYVRTIVARSIDYDFDWLGFTERITEAEEKNMVEYERRKIAYAAAMELLGGTYSPNDAVLKYLRKHAPEPPPDLDKEVKKVEKQYRAAVARREAAVRRKERADELQRMNEIKRQQNIEKQANYKLRQQDAIDRLIGSGFVLEVDFLRSNAISYEKLLIKQHGDLDTAFGWQELKVGAEIDQERTEAPSSDSFIYSE